MLIIETQLDASHSLIPVLFKNLQQLGEDPVFSFCKFEFALCPGRHPVWAFNVKIDPILRDRKELDVIFGENNKLNILSKLLGHEIKIKEVINRKYNKGSVLMDISYTLDFPEELETLFISHDVDQVIDEDSFTYIKLTTLQNIKPWETWSEYLQRLSVETHYLVFRKIVQSISPNKIDTFLNVEQTTEQRITFFKEKMIERCHLEFVDYIFSTPEFDYQHLVHLLNAMDNVQLHTTKLFKETSE